MEDHELLDRWCAGEKAAGAVLVERHFETVYGFLRNKVDDSAVDDLTQRTFLACVERPHNFSVDGRFKAYLLGVARKLLLMHYRSKHLQHRMLDRLQELSVDELAGSPSSVAAFREEQRVLLNALRRLPLRSQIVIELHYWEDLTTGEIAQVLEMPRGTIKTRLRRAREELRAAIDELATSDSTRQSTLTQLDGWMSSLRKRVAPRNSGVSGS